MMIEEHEDNAVPKHETLGNLFQRTRRSQHKTLEEAAAVTRVNPNNLAALEADDFARLPAEVFTRGFIKLYAKYLGIDPDEALRHYITQENADPEQPADRPYRRDLLDGEAMAHAPAFFKSNRRTIAIILLLAVLTVLYTLGKVYNPVGQLAEEATPVNEISRALVADEPQPVPEAGPAAADPAPVAASAGQEIKVLEPVALARKNPEAVAQSESSPARPVASAPVKLESATSTAPEPLAEPKPEPKPETKPAAKPQPPAVPKPAAAPAAMAASGAPAPETGRAAAVAAALPTGSEPSKSRALLPLTVKVATTAVDGVEAQPPAVATTTALADKYVLEAKFRESSWLHVEVDDQPVREYTSQADVTRIWRANQRLLLKLDNAEAVELTLNGEPLPLAGEPGEVVTVRIPSDSP